MLAMVPCRTVRSTFADLIAPIRIEHFLRQYWQKDLLLIDNRSEDSFAKMLTIDGIDELLSSIAIPINQVDIGTKAVGVPKSHYQRGSYADPNKVLKFHKEGHSIILRAMDNWLPCLRCLTTSTSRLFNSGATANIYITPPGQQSSIPHWDAHDIFVLQLHGKKTWDIHESLMSLPHPSYEFDARIHPVGAKVGEISISKGQCAYIPRGCVHNPHAETYSIHVALGVQVRTIGDALSQLLRRLSENHSELRRALPVKRGEFDLHESREVIRGALNLLADECGESLEIILKEIGERNKEGDRPNCRDVLNRIAQPYTVELATQISLKVGANYVNRNCFQINGIQYDRGTSLDEALRFVLSRQSFRVEEIPLPTDEMKIALSERLLDDGAVRVLAMQ